jgi:hypothetical protein
MWGTRTPKETERKQNCGEDARKLSLRNMWVTTVEDYRPGPLVTRFREGAVVGPPGLCSRAMRKMKRSAAWLREQAAQAIDKILGVSNGELLLESMLWLSEVAQEAHNSASTFKTTGDVAGALRHASAYSITFTDVTTLAHMPATHNTLYEDTYREAGDCIINPAPGFEYRRPPAQPVDVTSSTMLIHAEDNDLLDRWGGQHYESCEEDSFGDCSGDNTSDGRVSPEAREELPVRRLYPKLMSLQHQQTSLRILQLKLACLQSRQTPLRTFQFKLTCL